MDMIKEKIEIKKETFEFLYSHFNDRKYIHPDPLEFVYQYGNPLDREIVGLIASSLAFGKVEQIGISCRIPIRCKIDRPVGHLLHREDLDGVVVLSPCDDFRQRVGINMVGI